MDNLSYENPEIDENIKNILCQYQNYCMQLIDQCEEDSHIFSKRYYRKMKKIMWSQRNFGKDVKMGMYIRNVAAAVVLVITLALSSFGIVKAAQAFGWIDGWHFFNIGKDDSGLYHFSVKKKSSEELEEPQVIQKYEPSYIPKGFKEVTRKEHLPMYFGIEWYMDHKLVATFNITEMNEDMTFLSEYLPDTVETVKVKGHEMTAYPTDNAGETILWTDSWENEINDGGKVTLDYLYQISYDSSKITQEEIIKMVESMYEK